MTQHNELLKLLQKLEELFGGTLGTWKIDPVYFELKEDVKPIFLRPYTAPKIHEEMSKKDVESLVLLGVLEVANDSECGSPSFAQPKPKSNWVRFLSDFRHLNKKLKEKPYPMSMIDEMLSIFEGFQYATSLYLNIGYYHIQLSKNASNLCTIILLWGKYLYKRPPMGVANSPEIFQLKMNDLFHGIKFILAYIDKLLILTKGD